MTSDADAQDPFERLGDALDALHRHRKGDETVSDDDFLAENTRLRDLLEPMLVGDDSAGDQPDRDDAQYLGEFRLIREIGRGGMGVVYEAEQTSIGRRVALKVLPGSATLFPTLLARFKREAMTAGRLQHDGLVSVLSVGEHDGTPYFVMDLVLGAPLDCVIDALRDGDPTSLTGAEFGRVVAAERIGKLGENEVAAELGSVFERSATEVAVELVRQVADALHHAHEVGIVHRDVKPSNILVRPDGRALLTDFGLAREQGLPTISVTGDFVGTPGYVSPEQIDGRLELLDRRTDVFSLGVTLYELLTLKRPFQSGSTHEEMRRIVKREPTRPDRLNPRLSRDLCAIVEKALEKELHRRYQTAAELAGDLRAFLEYRPVSARPISRVGRVVRWMRREPWKAALSIVLLVGIVAMSGLGAYLAIKQDAIEAGESKLQRDRIEAELSRGFRALMARSSAGFIRSVFQGVLEVEPDNLDAVVGLVVIAGRSGRADVGAEVLDAADRRVPDAPVLRRLRAYVTSRRERAFFAGEWAKELGPPRDALECFAAGLIEFEAAMFGENPEIGQRAFELLDRACLLADRRRQYFVAARAEASRWIDDPAVAFEAVEMLETLWPDDVGVLSSIGLALSRADPQRAIDCFRRVIDAGAGGSHVHHDLAVLSIRAGELELAERHAREAVRLLPDAATFVSTLGDIRHRRGATEEGVAHLETAVGLEPRRPDLRYNLGVMYQAADRDADAAAEFERAVDLDPFVPEAWYQLGQIRWRSGDREGAVAAAAKAAELDPNDPAHLNDYGIFLSETGEHGAALEVFRQAIDLAPGDLLARRNGAACLFELGRTEEARDQLLRCAADHPEDAATCLMLGQVYFKLGNLADGAKWMARGATLKK